MTIIDSDSILKAYRRKPLFVPRADERVDNIDRRAIERIIPHRDPFLLVDAITAVNPTSRYIEGRRRIAVDDPIFAGHFPDDSIYPGSCTIEMIGQLSLCLYYFVEHNTRTVARDARPISVMATRILGAIFLSPIRPDDEVCLLANGIDSDGLFGWAVGQALVDNRVCCVSIGEVCFGNAA